MTGLQPSNYKKQIKTGYTHTTGGPCNSRISGERNNREL